MVTIADAVTMDLWTLLPRTLWPPTTSSLREVCQKPPICVHPHGSCKTFQAPYALAKLGWRTDSCPAVHTPATPQSAHQRRLKCLSLHNAGDGYASILASQSIYESGDPLDLALGEYVLKRSPVRHSDLPSTTGHAIVYVIHAGSALPCSRAAHQGPCVLSRKCLLRA